LKDNPTETLDLAGKIPQKVAVMNKEWAEWASENNVFPLSLWILANSLSQIFAQVEKISYRNWEKCYRIKNEKCEVQPSKREHMQWRVGWPIKFMV